MAIIAKAGGGSSTPPLEEGIYTGVCTRLIDLGQQFSEKYGKLSRRIMLGWDIAGEHIELSDGEKANRNMYNEYTTSLHEKSALRKDLQAWRGKAFTQEELDGFDLKQILGVPCQLQVIHNERNGNTYANISAIMAIPKGMPKPEGDYPQIYFDLDDNSTFSEYERIPDWIKDKIKQATNLTSTGFEEYLQNKNGAGNTPEGYTDIDDVNEDDLPF